MGRLASNLALAGLSLVLVFGLLEGALRVAPRQLMPAGGIGSGRYEPEIGLGVHGSPAIYNSVRFVENQPNSRGWLDVEHAREKPADVVRIGFFGDSYVEAAQVPIEQAFFRQLPERIGGVPVESLAFGMSGWGTLHAFRVARTEGERFDVDVQVYVFVENDPADNAWSISGSARPMPTPFAELREAREGGPGYALRWTHDPDALPWWHGPLKAVQSRLRVGQVLWSRLSLLRHARPVVPKGGEIAEVPIDSSMLGRTPPGAKPRPTDVPSSWPPAYRREASELGRRILAEWSRHAEARGRELVVLLVPRGEAHLRGEVPDADSWRGWLVATAGELGIPVIDPLGELARRSAAGVPMFDDHFSPAGHAAMAEILGEALVAPVRRAADAANSGPVSETAAAPRPRPRAPRSVAGP